VGAEPYEIGVYRAGTVGVIVGLRFGATRGLRSGTHEQRAQSLCLLHNSGGAAATGVTAAGPL